MIVPTCRSASVKFNFKRRYKNSPDWLIDWLKSATLVTGWTLSTGFGSEFASSCSDVRTRWFLNTCLSTANPSPASPAVATCDRLTVVILISHVWNLLRTEDVYLHTPVLRIGTHFLLTLETVVFLFHLVSATSKPFSSLSIRLAHAARLGFFYKNALYKFTVIIIIIIIIIIIL